AERCVGVCVVPCFAHVREISDGAFQRRDAGHLSRCIVWQNRRPAVDTGVAEPAFRTRYEANRGCRAAVSRQLADSEVALGAPRQAQIPGTEFARMRQIEERRQQIEFFDGTWRSELRDREDTLRGSLP